MHAPRSSMNPEGKSIPEPVASFSPERDISSCCSFSSTACEIFLIRTAIAVAVPSESRRGIYRCRSVFDTERLSPGSAFDQADLCGSTMTRLTDKESRILPGNTPTRVNRHGIDLNYQPALLLNISHQHYSRTLANRNVRSDKEEDSTLRPIRQIQDLNFSSGNGRKELLT